MAKKEKSLQDKFKQFFGIKEVTPINFDHLKTEPYKLNPELVKDLFPENSVNHRLKALRELSDIVVSKCLEENAVEMLYSKTEDMLRPHHTAETRHIVLHFYCLLIQSQWQKMKIMRSVFFRLVQRHEIAEDSLPRLEVLKALSDNGKNIEYFEEEIGPFLCSWFQYMLSTGRATEFLPLVVNTIKCNAAYLDENIIAGFIQYSSDYLGKTSVEEEIKWCLEVMDAVLCYSHLPSSVRNTFIFALCLTVNGEKFSQLSWKLMRNLLGTSVGHTTIFTLCVFLQDRKYQKVPGVLRGAVFFIGMALWGSKRVEALKHPPSAVLPAFLTALDYDHSIVAYEVALSVGRLVRKNHELLHSTAWDIILNIIERLLKYPELQQIGPPNSVLATCVHDLITVAEENKKPQCADKLYSIIETASDRLNEELVIRLVQHRTQHLHPVREDFMQIVTHLLEKYFKNEKRSSVQLTVVQILHNIRITCGHFFDVDVLDQTLLYYLSQIDTVQDVFVRKAVVDFLLELAENCVTKSYFDILDIVEKAMKRRISAFPGGVSDAPILSKHAHLDIEAAVLGLIKIFQKKLHTLPASHSVRIYNMLVNHMQAEYECLSYHDGNMTIRRLIMEYFLKIRTNSKLQVGMVVDEKVEYSMYVACVANRDILSEASSNAPISPTSTSVFDFFPMALCFEDMFQIIIKALKQEKDWLLLELMFKDLPKLLQNKALLITGKCSMNSLCFSLWSLINDQITGYPETLYNTPSRLTRTEFRAHVFPVITCLTAYHSQLDSHFQRVLIKCLESGLVSRSARVCIEGLTLCTLEMRNMLVKLMPEVLIKLSQISATVTVAVPVLEFLSNLIRLPQLYVSFVEDQYRRIFAIALPYTNPYKFNQYTVALAHHVIAMWFLKCRIPFRRELATYITKGLRSNMSLPYDNNSRNKNNIKEGAASDKNSSGSPDASLNKSLVTLHTELFEIGQDLMARFTFGMCSNAPKRSEIADFLLEKGQKSSWIIDNKIITITTSGCGTKAFKRGLCEKCYASCRAVCDIQESDDSESAFSPTPEPPEEPLPSQVQKPVTRGRRRHKSAYQGSSTLSSELHNPRGAKDDILLHQQRKNADEQLTRTPVASKIIPETAANEELSVDEGEKKSGSYQLCSCWCSGWAEIHIRRPTGTSSWMLRIQNHLFLPTTVPSVPLPAISSLLLPNKSCPPQSTKSDKTETIPLDPKVDDEPDVAAEETEEASSSAISEALSCPKPKVNLRRSNSSPDMNSGWANYGGHMNAEQKHVIKMPSTVEAISELDSDSFEMFHLEEKDEIREIKSRPPVYGARDSPSKFSRSNTVMNMNLDLGLRQSSGANMQNQSSSGTEPTPVNSGFRDRGYTISVMSPIRSTSSGVPQSQSSKEMHRSGMSPSFVFLQLYHDNYRDSCSHKPLLLRQTEQNTRSLRVLDHIHPYDTHKIGVIYVGPGQVNDEVAILGNLYGSVRYVDFLRGLGNLVLLSEVDHELTYVGGLDLNGADGNFALVWHDDVMRVAFHVATFMPNKKSEPQRNNKKTHIGNNFVTIVYNESGEEYEIGTIKSQFTTSCVIIRPEDFNSNVVTIKVKTDKLLETFGHTEAYIVSDESLPIFVRQMALHANLASLILDPRQQSAHVSNWLARLRCIRRLRTKVLEELKSKGDAKEGVTTTSHTSLDDFTDYI